LGAALREVNRDQIILTTKLISTSARETRHDLEQTLKELATDYVDICLVHGVRNLRDFSGRIGALNELVKSKEAGKIRAIGLSSHGIEALEIALEFSEIEVVWARINYAGVLMDTRNLGLYDTLASMSWTKKIVKMLPKCIVAPARPTPSIAPVPERNRQEVERLLSRLHEAGKGVVGMKIFAEGRLGHDPRKAFRFANDLSYLDAYIIGMTKKEEIEQNCRLTV
jgi:predicted aldo/keto reductase-like oxidoreductase